MAISLIKEVRPIKLPLYVYKRINGQEYYCGYGQLYRENLKHKKEPIPAKEIGSSRKHYLK